MTREIIIEAEYDAETTRECVQLVKYADELMNIAGQISNHGRHCPSYIRVYAAVFYHAARHPVLYPVEYGTTCALLIAEAKDIIKQARADEIKRRPQ